MRRPRFIARQASCPSGLVGRFLARIMARETAAENAATLRRLEIEPADRLLEIGFGHGRTIALAAALTPLGHVSGIEVAPDMVAMAAKRAAAAIRDGRVDLRRAEGTSLPYDDASFEKVYSVHTIYFWRAAEAVLKEIHRVLRPGGRLALTFRHGAGFATDLPAPIYTHRSPEQVAALVASAGFDSIDVDREPPLYILVATRKIGVEDDV